MITKTKRFLSWPEIDQAVAELRDLIYYPVGEVLPVLRGGLVPAAMLAYAMELPVGPSVDLEGEQGSSRHDLLIVDDIADTGKTFRALRHRFPNALLVSLFAKPAGRSAVDECAREAGQDEWIVFPWATHDVINR